MPGACDSRFPIPGHAKRANGFTLIEMLVVIVLIGITAAVVAVSVTHGLSSARIHAASSDLAAALRYTRSQAIVHAKQETLTVDVTGHTYKAPGRPQVKLPAGMGLKLTSAVADRIDDHRGRIRFFPDGSSTGGRVTLSHGQREWHVNVAWLTGTVAVVQTRAGG
jgi:general secretion pathway protein H